MLLKEEIQQFLSGLAGIRSPATVQWYSYMLANLSNELGSFDVKLISLDHLRLWRAKLFDRKLSIWSVRDYIRAAKTLFTWLVAEKQIHKSPADRLEMPKLPRRPRLGISSIDKEKLIEAAQSNPRDLALVLFIASTLCRRGGAANLTWTDLDLDHRRAFVTEKGDKTREVYLSFAAVSALQAWRLVAPDRDSVFGLKPNSIYEVFRKLSQQAGVQGANPHAWRHAGARQMIRNGANLTEVQQLLGHENIQTTAQFYGTLDHDELQDAHDHYLGD